MTTIVDPAGTPIPVYNKSGTTVQSITGVSGSPPTISNFSNEDIVLFTAGAGDDGSNEHVYLPADADIGDVVEIYATAGYAYVYPSTGHVIVGFTGSGYLPVGVTDGGVRFRKVSATNWQPLGKLGA